MNEAIFQLLSQFATGFVVLLVGWVAGRIAERRHLRRLDVREWAMREYHTTSLEDAPAEWEIVDRTMVTGSVVIALDAYKKVIAQLKMMFGGRVRAYEPLLHRARREALLRMQIEARTLGYHGIINVRFETSTVGLGTEVLCFGTAVRRTVAFGELGRGPLSRR